MMGQPPMTKEQRENLNRSLARIMEILADITALLRGCYNDQDPPVWRAEEARAAMQRILWAIDRQVPIDAWETYTAEESDRQSQWQ